MYVDIGRYNSDADGSIRIRLLALSLIVSYKQSTIMLSHTVCVFIQDIALESQCTVQ